MKFVEVEHLEPARAIQDGGDKSFYGRSHGCPVILGPGAATNELSIRKLREARELWLLKRCRFTTAIRSLSPRRA